MADIVDRATRSRMMSGITGRNTKPEIAVRSYLHRRGLRFRLHSRGLIGTPDVVLKSLRVVVLVHGCFWHRHRNCRFAYTPKTNQEFWTKKFEANVARDARQRRDLAKAGWRVFVVWECQARGSKYLENLYRAIVRERLPPVAPKRRERLKGKKRRQPRVSRRHS